MSNSSSECAIKHVKMHDVDIETPDEKTTISTGSRSCGFRCGRCMRRCCGSGKLSFCELCRSTDMSCRDACVLTSYGGAACTIVSMVTSLLGVCCIGIDQCCARPNQPRLTCNFCGWVLYAWQAILFVASWFMGISVFLFVLCITIFLVRRYGVGCCNRCGCKDCASGFAEEIV
jgi:hypothetical protein